jgi:hypothetical protein
MMALHRNAANSNAAQWERAVGQTRMPAPLLFLAEPIIVGACLTALVGIELRH